MRMTEETRNGTGAGSVSTIAPSRAVRSAVCSLTATAAGVRGRAGFHESAIGSPRPRRIQRSPRASSIGRSVRTSIQNRSSRGASRRSPSSRPITVR